MLLMYIKEELLPKDRYEKYSSIEKAHEIQAETTTSLVLHIRSVFPYMAVISYDHHSDKNEDAWIVDFDLLDARFKPKRVESFNPYHGRDYLGPKSEYFITNIGLLDLDGLIKGLINMQQPAFYLYLTSENEIDIESIGQILESVPNESRLRQELLEKVSLLVELGPDADYHILSTKNKENYERLNFLSL